MKHSERYIEWHSVQEYIWYIFEKEKETLTFQSAMTNSPILKCSIIFTVDSQYSFN